MTPLAERFLAKVEVDNTTGCWVWSGCTQSPGYGRFRFDGETVYTHRLAYEQIVGPIPTGLVLDHLCRNHPCCNPDHLEPVTQAENVRRGKGNGWQLRSHCINGHEFTGERNKNGTRICRICDLERSRRGKARARERARQAAAA